MLCFVWMTNSPKVKVIVPLTVMTINLFRKRQERNVAPDRRRTHRTTKGQVPGIRLRMVTDFDARRYTYYCGPKIERRAYHSTIIYESETAIDISSMHTMRHR